MFEKMGIKLLSLLFAFMLVMGFGMNLHADEGFDAEEPAAEEYGGAEGYETPAPEDYEEYKPEEYEEPEGYEEYEPEEYEEEYEEPDF